MLHQGLIEEIDISKINFARYALRVNVGAIEELAASIAEKDLLQPIVVRVVRGRYEVVAGNRRLTACRLLKWRKIPCHIVELDDKEAFEVSLIENVQRKTLNPIEEAVAFKKYVEDFGWGGISHLALKIGKSQEYVSRRVQLLQLPGKVQEKIMRRRISPSIAQELLTLDSKIAEKFAEMIENKGLKRNEIRRVVRSVKIKNTDIFDKEPSSQTQEEVVSMIDSALKKCVTILKSTLVRLDEVITEVDEDWITKEMLMQYRMIVHGDIDAFLRLRKKLERKVRPDYISSAGTGDSKTDDDDTSLHVYKGVWQ